MTAGELATLLRAKKCGKGTWVAKCVAHSDRTPSLSIREGRKGVVLKCQSCGCSVKDICGALGITVESLFYDSGREVNREMRSRCSDEQKLDRLTGKLSAITFLLGAERANASYWEACLRNVVAEMEPLYWKLMPDQERFDKARAWELKDYSSRRMDWLRRQDVERNGVLGSSRPSDMEQGHVINRARAGAEAAEGDVRIPQQLYLSPRALPRGGVPGDGTHDHS